MERAHDRYTKQLYGALYACDGEHGADDACVWVVAQSEDRAWLQRLTETAQAYLDEPNATTRGKLERVLKAVQRRAS